MNVKGNEGLRQFRDGENRERGKLKADSKKKKQDSGTTTKHTREELAREKQRNPFEILTATLN